MSPRQQKFARFATQQHPHDEFPAPLPYAREDQLRAESLFAPLGGCDLEHCLRMRE